MEDEVMKRVTLIKGAAVIVVAFLFLSGFTEIAGRNRTNASDNGIYSCSWGTMQGTPQGGWMMSNGMMNGYYNGMMGGMWRYQRMISMLPQMQSQFTLTNEQDQQLLDLQTAYRKKQIDLQATQQKRQLELQSLLNDNASPQAVKKQLESCAEINIELTTNAYTTAQQMRNVLNESQQKQLHGWMMNYGQNTHHMNGYMNHHHMNGYGMGAGMMMNN